ncbi:MAG: hypothetical protein N3A61_00195 [Ignavibacteria bacterium]|nr:hypothetical protein [Ignavibacteria bacterium]
MLTFFDTWLPFLYLYGVGGIFFVLGLYITHKAGSMNLKKSKHRYWFKVLIFGFIYLMAIHAFLIYIAINW